MKPTTPATRIAIDLNVRARGNGTYAGFEHVEGPIVIDDEVEVYEAETGAVGRGRIFDVDVAKRIVFLDVDWTSIHVPPRMLLIEKSPSFELRVRVDSDQSTLHFEYAA
jgi:hypothetical protein